MFQWYIIWQYFAYCHQNQWITKFFMYSGSINSLIFCLETIKNWIVILNTYVHAVINEIKNAVAGKLYRSVVTCFQDEKR